MKQKWGNTRLIEMGVENNNEGAIPFAPGKYPNGLKCGHYRKGFKPLSEFTDHQTKSDGNGLKCIDAPSNGEYSIMIIIPLS